MQRRTFGYSRSVATPRDSPVNCDQSARHEAAHVVAARALGWIAGSVRIFPRGGGEASVVSPKGLGWRRRNREFAVIALAAHEFVCWTAIHGERHDLRDAHRALSELTHYEWECARLKKEMRRQARELVEKPEFRARARRVTKALEEFGELDARDLDALLRRDDFRYEPGLAVLDVRIRA
jgi:hypothetical protein